MAQFKLCIGHQGKTYQKEIKDNDAEVFVGKNLGEVLNGESFGMSGEFVITGGSDNCGFPMRRGIKGIRKKLTLLGGVGLRTKLGRGVKKKKTVCGHKITPQISQINLKLVKEGSKKIGEFFDGEKKGEEKQ